MNTMTINAPQPVSSGFRVDLSRGERIGHVSSEWFSRSDDERYLSLTELYDAVKVRADRAKARAVESRAVQLVKTLEAEDSRIELRAVAGTDYGCIWDHELVAAIMKIAGSVTGDNLYILTIEKQKGPASGAGPSLFQNREVRN
jgi:hypothetical protein